jgi:murein L,D-transpeptidase YafK
MTLRTICFSFFVMIISAVMGQSIPSNERSREVIARITPGMSSELEESGLRMGSPILIRIFKEEKELEVWIRDQQAFRLFKTYAICTYGSGTLGPKLRQGDGQAPEGFYRVYPSSLNPASEYHLSFNLGYPNEYDRAHRRTGSALMVHGARVSIGCYAMTDEFIEEIYTLADAAFRGGQPFFYVHAFPFRMTDANLRHHSDSEWHSFWMNLGEGDEAFTASGHIPPAVSVENKWYVFK